MSIQIALIGCGGIAKQHLNSYLKIHKKAPGKVELIAVCDTMRQNAEVFAQQVKDATGKMPVVYEDLDDVLAKEDLQGADICTPHAYHHISAIKCLNAGVNVMVEKPIGITVRATHAIIKAAKASGKFAATAENIRRMTSRRTAWWLMNEKKMLGDMTMFFAQQASYSAPNPEREWRWRIDLFLGGGGAVMDSGAHFCDTIRYLYGDPDTVYGRVCQLEDRKVTRAGEIVQSDQEDTWVSTINFKRGAIGTWTCTRSAPGHSFMNIVHYGTEGCLIDQKDIFHGPWDNAEIVLKDGTRYVMEDLKKEYLASLTEQERERLFPCGVTEGDTAWDQGFFLECYDFVDAIENNRPPEIDAEMGLRAKSICESIYESSACGQAVEYDDVVNGKVEVYQKPINEHWGL